MSSLGDLLTLFRGDDTSHAELTDSAADGEDAPRDGAPLFQVDIFFEEPDIIDCEPSGNQLSASIDATVSDFVWMLKTHVGTLISNEQFRRFTQPVINGRQDSVEINEGFDI
eukprot:1937353-Pleurochrysis_carterae.AAC.1